MNLFIGFVWLAVQGALESDIRIPPPRPYMTDQGMSKLTPTPRPQLSAKTCYYSGLRPLQDEGEIKSSWDVLRTSYLEVNDRTYLTGRLQFTTNVTKNRLFTFSAFFSPCLIRTQSAYK